MTRVSVLKQLGLLRSRRYRECGAALAEALATHVPRQPIAGIFAYSSYLDWTTMSMVGMSSPRARPAVFPRVGSQASLCLERQILARRSAPKVSRPSEQGPSRHELSRSDTRSRILGRAIPRPIRSPPAQPNNSRAPRRPLLLRRRGRTQRLLPLWPAGHSRGEVRVGDSRGRTDASAFVIAEVSDRLGPTRTPRWPSPAYRVCRAAVVVR